VQEQARAISDFELSEQGGNVKLYGAFREIEPRADFFVGEVVFDPAEHFLLTATERDGREIVTARLDEFYGTTRQSVEKILVGGNHHTEVLGHLPARNAVHRQEACRPISRQASVIARLDFESLRSGFLVEKTKSLGCTEKSPAAPDLEPGLFE
jgi:hypothetical protein